MVQKYILAHDLGTGGNKAVLYSSEGKLISKAFKSYDTYYPYSGWAEHNPQDWWEAVIESTKKLLAATEINKKNIACISLSGHSMGIVPVDKEGKLLRKTVPLWNDSRAIDKAREILKFIGYDYWYEKTGAGFRPENHSIFKLAWFKENEPDMFNSTYKFLPTKGFITLKLTGNFISDYSDASFSGLMDINELKYSEEIFNLSGLPVEKMPVLLKSVDYAGELTKEASELLGIPSGIAVINGGVDNACTAIGAGNIKENRIYNYIGSSSWIAATSAKPIINSKIKIPCYAHSIPNLYLSQVSVFSTGSTLQWYKDIFCDKENLQAEKSDGNVYSMIEKNASYSPVGSNNIIFIPSFRGGATVSPNSYLRGAFLGLELSHNKNDINRAVLEGISFELALALKEYVNLGMKSKDIRITGGGSKSKFWRQMLADVFGIDTILTSIDQEAAAFGAAAIGAVGTGIWKDFSIVDEIVKQVDVSKPDKQNVRVYKEILHKFKYAMDKVGEINEFFLKNR
jgi:xylulokinase